MYTPTQCVGAKPCQRKAAQGRRIWTVRSRQRCPFQFSSSCFIVWCLSLSFGLGVLLRPLSPAISPCFHPQFCLNSRQTSSLSSYETPSWIKSEWMKWRHWGPYCPFHTLIIIHKIPQICMGEVMPVVDHGLLSWIQCGVRKSINFPTFVGKRPWAAWQFMPLVEKYVSRSAN